MQKSSDWPKSPNNVYFRSRQVCSLVSPAMWFQTFLLFILLPENESACLRYSCIVNNGEWEGVCQNYPYNKCSSIENCDGHCDNVDRQCQNNDDCKVYAPTPFPLSIPSPTMDFCYHSTRECEALHHGQGECFSNRLMCYRAGGSKFLPGLCGKGHCGCCVGFETVSSLSPSTVIFIIYMVIDALVILGFRYVIRRKERIRELSGYYDEFEDDYSEDFEERSYDSSDEEEEVYSDTSSAASREHRVTFKEEAKLKTKNPRFSNKRTVLRLPPLQERNSEEDKDEYRSGSGMIESMSVDRERPSDPNNRSFTKRLLEEEGSQYEDTDSQSSFNNGRVVRPLSRSAPRANRDGHQEIDSPESEHEEEEHSRLYNHDDDGYDNESGDDDDDKHAGKDEEVSSSSSDLVLRALEERQRKLDILCDDCCGDFEWWHASAWVGWSFRLFLEALLLPFVLGFLIYRWCYRQASHREDILYERADSDDEYSYYSDESYDSFTSSGEESEQGHNSRNQGSTANSNNEDRASSELEEGTSEYAMKFGNQIDHQDGNQVGLGVKEKPIGLKAKMAKRKAERAAAALLEAAGNGSNIEDGGGGDHTQADESIDKKKGTHHHGVHGLPKKEHHPNQSGNPSSLEANIEKDLSLLETEFLKWGGESMATARRRASLLLGSHPLSRQVSGGWSASTRASLTGGSDGQSGPPSRSLRRLSRRGSSGAAEDTHEEGANNKNAISVSSLHQRGSLGKGKSSNSKKYPLHLLQPGNKKRNSQSKKLKSPISPSL